MTTLREAAQQALEAMGYVGADWICEASHHAKKDQHKLGEPCPLQQRWHVAYQALRAALAEPNHDYERGFVGGMSEQVRRDVERDVMASLERFYAIAVTTEREACAKVCEETRFPDSYTAIRCAAAIRARGEQKQP